MCGRDLDDVFAYPSVKMVRIRDARLGLFKLLLLVAIVLYVALYELAYQGLYLRASPVTGAVRFTLQQPTKDACDPQAPTCSNDFGRVEDRAYCAQATTPDDDDYAGTRHPCEYYESAGVAVVQANALLVTTRLTTARQRLACSSLSSSDSSTTCPSVYNTTATETTYVTDAERFTVLVDHSVRAASGGDLAASRSSSDGTTQKSTSSDLKGRLYVAKNDALCRRHDGRVGLYGSRRTSSAPCYVPPNETATNLDYFELDVLLAAAGADLDQPNPASRTQTYRETGASLLLTIEYANFRPWHGPSDLRYSYRPDLVDGSSYKRYDEVYEPPEPECHARRDDNTTSWGTISSSDDDDVAAYRRSRTLLNRHGIFIEAAQGGTVRTFLFNNLLVQITTSLTLLAVATVLTDLVALYVMPDRAVYEDYKYDTTPDFGDLRRAQQSSAPGSGDPISLDDDDVLREDGRGRPSSTSEGLSRGSGAATVSLRRLFSSRPAGEPSATLQDPLLGPSRVQAEDEHKRSSSPSSGPPP